jgi:uncharacterized protein
MIIKELEDKGFISPPPWLSTNVHYLTLAGSVAYGVSSDTSDMDIYGFCTPKKQTVFPHLAGEILGFGTQVPRFDQWQQHVKQPLDNVPQDITYEEIVDELKRRKVI